MTVTKTFIVWCDGYFDGWDDQPCRNFIEVKGAENLTAARHEANQLHSWKARRRSNNTHRDFCPTCWVREGESRALVSADASTTDGAS